MGCSCPMMNCCISACYKYSGVFAQQTQHGKGIRHRYEDQGRRAWLQLRPHVTESSYIRRRPPASTTFVALMPTSDSRSNNGCWTCRARRKKCDESSQPCQVCTRLHLTCYGYGTRPAWMDGSCDEKAKVIEFKAAVKRHSKHRRRSKTINQHDADSNSTIMDRRGSEEDQTLTRNPLASPLTPVENSSTFFPSSALDSDESNERNSDPFELLFSSHDVEQYMNLDTFDDFSRITDFQNRPEGEDCEILPTTAIQPLYLPLSPEIESADALENIVASTPDHRQPSQWDKTIRGNLSTDDRYLINAYFQHSFGSQLPFLEQSTSTLIVRQLSMLAACSHSCSASLASHGMTCRVLSLSRLFPSISHNGNHTSVDGDGTSHHLNHDVVSQAADGSANLDNSLELQNIEAQVCVAQRLHSEVICEPNAWPSQIDILASLQPLDYNLILGGRYSQLTAFQSLLISIDIIASTSTGETPSFALQFRDRLEMADLSLEHALGCKSAVMGCIMDISDLQAWSYQQSLQASPSLIELARRALKIEQKLEKAQQENHLEDSLMDHHQEQQIRHHPTNSRLISIRVITNIFACAASIYLHVIVSGAHPKVPEIKRGVTETIGAISSIPNAELIKSLAWPMCIAACMADGDQHRGFFEKLEEGVTEEFGRSQRVLRVFRVARECWRLRDIKSGNSSNGLNGKAYNWRDSMASLRERFLLL